MFGYMATEHASSLCSSSQLAMQNVLFFHFQWHEEINGICVVEGLKEKLAKLKQHDKDLYEKKVTKVQKKVSALEKKHQQFVSKNKPDVEQVAKELQKARTEFESLEKETFAYESSKPLTRMQTEAEFAARSARAKALESALAASESKDGGDADPANPTMGSRAAQIAAASRTGVSMQKKKKTSATDKSLRDIFKLGSHVLKWFWG